MGTDSRRRMRSYSCCEAAKRAVKRASNHLRCRCVSRGTAVPWRLLANLQKMLEERVDHRVGLLIGAVLGTIGHQHAVVVAEQAIDVAAVVECLPALDRV